MGVGVIVDEKEANLTMSMSNIYNCLFHEEKQIQHNKCNELIIFFWKINLLRKEHIFPCPYTRRGVQVNLYLHVLPQWPIGACKHDQRFGLGHLKVLKKKNVVGCGIFC
jgi:hypothetical protein